MTITTKAKTAGFLKIGARVSCPHPSGKRYEGRVDGNDRKKNGLWVAVNIAPRLQNRILRHFRPSQLILLT